MREIHIKQIRDSIENLCIEANYNISEDIKNILIDFKEIEDGVLAKGILEKIIINIKFILKKVKKIEPIRWTSIKDDPSYRFFFKFYKSLFH